MRPRIPRSAFLIGSTLALVAAARSSFGWISRRGLPQTQGAIRLPFVGADVEIVRDRWGVPHVYAHSDDDLLFAQGFVHAQDRSFQLDLNRRAATGRLSEVFGPLTLPVDRFFRRVNLQDVAEAELRLLDAESSRALQAYCRGVNAALELQAGRWPVEFTLLRTEPEPWTPRDCLVWAKFLAFTLSPNIETELLRARLVERVGPDVAARLEPQYPAGGPVTVPPGACYGGSIDFAAAYRAVAPFAVSGGGSNAWAVDGTRTASGLPLLANDPHLPPQLPSLWYTVDLHGDRLHVAGASLPGLPGVMLGHNDRIAWGVTALMGDVQDLYVERLHPDNPRQYLYRGEWLPAMARVETIRVRGRRQPVREDVLVTHHGPIVSPALGADLPPMALRSALLEPGEAALAGLRLMRAENWDEFRAALERFPAPALNYVYADADGNVGYQLAGRIPQRARGSGLVPACGWTGEEEWSGFIPFDELPSALNPPTHTVATANNCPADGMYPYYLGHEFCDRYRVERILDLLDAYERHDVATFGAIQTDVFSRAGVELARQLGGVVPPNDAAERALGLLRTWDGQVRADSAAATVYEVLRLRLLRNAVSPVLGDLTDAYLGLGLHALSPTNSYAFRSTSFLLDLVQRADPDWLPGVRTDWPDLLARSLAEAADEIRRLLGPHPEKWQWGRLHRARLTHPLGRIGPVGRIFNLGPVEVDGDVDTVCQFARNAADGWAATGWLPSCRLVVDLADFDRSVVVNSTGQSGQPASPHYADQFHLWAAGQSHPLLWTRARVQEAAEAVLVLRRG
ncbi:MAG: penicillin acylase family protein [Chloroflexi bacterium]|nr:penicillin acylase family protein [Chloroflexota bacterium]